MRKFFKTMTMLLILTSFLVLPGVGFAEEYTTGEEVKKEDEKTEEKVQKLEKIVVEAKKVKESIAAESIAAPKLEEVGHNVEIITGEEIKEAGFVDLAKAVEAMVPGIFSSTRSGRGGYNYVSLHGSNDILWLLDGVRINNRLYGNSHWTFTLSVHMIDRIEILKGGESLFYGTGARAGVINVITKDITEEKSGEFGTSYGEEEYREVYGHVTETFNGHGLMAFGSHETYDGYQVCDDQAYRDALSTVKDRSTGFDRTTVGGKYRKEFDLAGKGVLSAQLQNQQGYFDYPYPAYRTAFNGWEEDIGLLKWDHDINDNFSYYIKSYFHRWWGECTFIDLDGSYSWGEDGSRSNHTPWGYEDYGVNLMTSTRWGKGHEILSGIDYQNYWGKEEVMGVSSTDREEVYGFFASYRPYLPFSPNTRLAMGARHTITGEETDSTIWDVSMKTPIAGQIYFRGIVGTSFKLPSSMQLYGDDPINDRYGNPDLDPEESLNVEVGVGGDWRYFHCDAGYFFHEIEDMIQSVTLDSGDRTYENVDGKTQIDGIEVSAGIGPFSGFSFDASATWVDADNEDGEQQERIPKFYAQANVKYRYPTGRFGADLMTRYTGDIYERGFSTFDDVNYGDYYLADVSAFVKFGREKEHKLTLRVENIFDKEYASRYGTIRNADGDRFLYNQYGLPRNVVIGYTYTF